RGERQPTADLLQHRAGCHPCQSRPKLDSSDERGDVSEAGPLDQRIGPEAKRHRDHEGCALLYHDLDDRAHIRLGGHQLTTASPDRRARIGGDQSASAEPRDRDRANSSLVSASACPCSSSKTATNTACRTIEGSESTWSSRRFPSSA